MPVPDHGCEITSEPPEFTFSLRALFVATGVIAFALFMIRGLGPAAIVLTPVAYLYFVLFSPTDRPSGEAIINIVVLLVVGSMLVFVLYPTFYR